MQVAGLERMFLSDLLRLKVFALKRDLVSLRASSFACNLAISFVIPSRPRLSKGTRQLSRDRPQSTTNAEG